MASERLIELLNEARAEAQADLAANGGVGPMFKLIREEQTGRIDRSLLEEMGCDMNDPNDKARIAHVIRMMSAFIGATHYVFYCEAWAVRQTTEEHVQGKDLSEDPNRFEIVSFIVEDRDNILFGRQSIIRPRGQPPEFYGEVEYSIDKQSADAARGRFVGVLRHELTPMERTFLEREAKGFMEKVRHENS